MRLKALVLAVMLAIGPVLLAPPAWAQQPTLPLAAPETQGFSKERLGRIADVMKGEIEKGTIPGAITLIARGGKIVHYETHGFLDAAKTRPMRKEAIFRIASMTKPIVSAAAMMMVEQGRFKLNDPVGQYLPELKDMKVETKKADGAVEDVAIARAITVQDLLRHTAGFTYSFGGQRSERIKNLYLEADIETQKSDITSDEMIKRLAGISLVFQPATSFEYSVSIDVLGILMERVSGKPLDRLLDEMIFRPLKMKDTAFYVPPEKASRLADALDSDPNKAWIWKWIRVTDNGAGKRYFNGGGGLVSTTEDYWRFAQMIVNGGELDGVRLLSKKTVEFMLSDHLVGMGGSAAGTTGPGYTFGLGFGVRKDDGFGWVPGSKGDAMWAGICGTSFTIDPREKLVGVFMAQGPTTRIHTRMLFKNLLYGAVVR